MSGNKVSRYLRTITFVLFGGLFLVLLALFILWIPWKKHVSISGRVIDQQTGERVADARVIVTLVSGFPYQRFMGYGLRTDENGEFSLDVNTPRKFNTASVEASTPNNGYDLVSSAGEVVTLKTAPLPANRRGWQHLHYKEFRGSAGFGVGNPLQFVGRGW